MKKLFSFIFLALLPVVANAYDDLYYEEVPGYDAKIDGIYYVFPNQSEAKVSYLMYIIHIRHLKPYNMNLRKVLPNQELLQLLLFWLLQ